MTPLSLSEQEAIHALRHAHEWLERVDARATGYFGLDHKQGENEDGCTICHAVAVLEGRTEQSCTRCENDGWIELFDKDGKLIGTAECPHLHEPGHPRFNATGMVDRPWSTSYVRQEYE